MNVAVRSPSLGALSTVVAIVGCAHAESLGSPRPVAAARRLAASLLDCERVEIRRIDPAYDSVHRDDHVFLVADGCGRRVHVACGPQFARGRALCARLDLPPLQPPRETTAPVVLIHGHRGEGHERFVEWVAFEDGYTNRFVFPGSGPTLALRTRPGLHHVRLRLGTLAPQPELEVVERGSILPMPCGPSGTATCFVTHRTRTLEWRDAEVYNPLCEAEATFTFAPGERYRIAYDLDRDCTLFCAREVATTDGRVATTPCS
ncbi:MAG: hypothetical protein NZ898_06770 [Myxococcota bacterium]|nr:hypothetical protein [Myxococcota bacterium]MDW8361844.1 hypothetical protein [Myxococcales bacterium]